MLSYLLVYTMSLILISTDIKRYEKEKITGTVIKSTMVSQACFTKAWYWTLVNLGNGGIFSLRAILRKRCYFWRAGRKRLYCLLSRGPTTAKC